MGGHTRIRVAALVAGLTLISAGTVVVSTGSLSADDGQVTQAAGVLRVHLSNAGSTITYSGPLQVPSSQAISIDNKCGATTSATLLGITHAGGTGLGLVSNGLGVRTKPTCATAQGQIAGSRTVTLALGTAFPADVVVDRAELDIEGKHDAQLGVRLDASDVTNIALSHASDNGPDSGVGDNDRVTVDDTFRSITLSAVTGEVALEGGGDGSYAQYAAAGGVGTMGVSLGSADTLLRLVRVYDHAVPCNDTVDATLFGGSATSALFERGLNDGVASAAECEDIPVTLHILDSGVKLLKTTTGLQTGATQAVNSQLTIHWKPIPAPVAVPLPARQVDFDGPDGTAFAFENVKWCTGSGPSGPIHPADTRFGTGGVLPWCLVSSSETLQADGSVVQVQVYDGSGDPFWR